MTTVRDVMTKDPVILAGDADIRDAARAMRDHDIGDVLIRHDDGRVGVVTDRDLVVRALADGRAECPLGEIASDDVVGVPADASTDEAVQVMRERAVRRVPVVENSRVVGIVSIGDLAKEQDRNSALADISTAPPNH